MKTSQLNLKALLALLASFLLAATTAHASNIATGQVAYWNFDAFTPGDTGANHPSRGGDATEGTFADQWNANTVYAATLENSLNDDPFDSTGGRFGGAFYSKYAPPAVSGTSSAFGAVGVADHNAALDFAPGESFTVSSWVKVDNRESNNASFQPGFGRSIYWLKGVDPTNGGTQANAVGLGLRNNGATFGVVGDKGNAFGQDYYGVNGAGFVSNYSTTPGITSLDDDRWMHMLMVGTYNAGSDDVTINTYVDGQLIPQLTVTVEDEDISTPGPLGIGQFWRQNDGGGAFGSPGQHGLGWNARDAVSDPGEGWLDDMAMIDVAFTAGEAIGTFNLAEQTELNYDMGKVIQLLDLHRDGAGSVDVGDGLTWSFATNLVGTDGQLTGAGSNFTLVLDAQAGTGLVGAVAASVPEPASALLVGLGLMGLVMRRRRK